MQIDIISAILNRIEFPSNMQIYYYFCQIDIAEGWGWRIYPASTRKWRHIRKGFGTQIKVKRMEIEIIAALFQWFSKQQVNCHCFCKMDIGKRGCWRVYQATMGNWYQIGKWFWTHIKCLRLQIEIIASIFDWFSKQQVNLSLFLSDWFCRKLGLTDLPDHHGKDL